MSPHIFLKPKSPYFFLPKFVIVIKTLFILPFLLSSNLHALSTSSLPNVHFTSQNLPHNNEQEISYFRTLNRRHLGECSSNNPYLEVNINAISPLSDEQNINITVSGISQPSDRYWVAMISPSHSRYVRSFVLNNFSIMFKVCESFTLS